MKVRVTMKMVTQALGMHQQGEKMTRSTAFPSFEVNRNRKTPTLTAAVILLLLTFSSRNAESSVAPKNFAIRRLMLPHQRLFVQMTATFPSSPSHPLDNKTYEALCKSFLGERRKRMAISD